MKNFKLTGNRDLQIIASQNSSVNDFDFYEGHWEIRNRKLNERLNDCDEWTEFTAHQEMQIILQGFGNTDNFITELDGKPFEGRTIRLFDPKTKLWSMYWTDSSNPILQPPTIGSFEGNIGRFYAPDSFGGQPIIVQFKWDKTDPNNPTWAQAFSTDEGKTWEWNWYMFMSRNK